VPDFDAGPVVAGKVALAAFEGRKARVKKEPTWLDSQNTKPMTD
jgi:hypothetical protein